MAALPPGLLREIAWGAVPVLAAVAGFLVWRHWRRPTPEQLERARRLHVHKVGRLAGGEILEMLPAPGDGELPPTLVYQYEFGGVTYQASQALHLIPATFDPQSWIPGWPVQVKFDPSNPGNSIIACEHWQGLASSRKSSAAGSQD